LSFSQLLITSLNSYQRTCDFCHPSQHILPLPKNKNGINTTKIIESPGRFMLIQIDRFGFSKRGIEIKTKIKDDFEDQHIVKKSCLIVSHAGKRYNSGHYVTSIQNTSNNYILFNYDKKPKHINLFTDINFDIVFLLCEEKKIIITWKQ